jgi:dihydroflavonol-4-reductase
MVAITGATGLLGGHILDKFLQENVETIALCRPEYPFGMRSGAFIRQADVLDQVSLREAFAGVTTVIHAAAFVSFNPRRQKKIFEVNVEGTRNVVDTCLMLGIKNLVHISSVAALGRTPAHVITEESKWTGLMRSDYAESKYLAELEVFRGAEEGLNVSLVNPSVILSASQRERSSGTLFNYVWKQRPFYTDGKLNYVDARDVADAVFKLYEKPRPGEKFILSAGQVSYQQFFEMVAKGLNKRAPSVKIGQFLSYWAGLAEEVRATLLNGEPMVTRQSARMAMQSFTYSNAKAQSIGLTFRPLEETIAWSCGALLAEAMPNK